MNAKHKKIHNDTFSIGMIFTEFFTREFLVFHKHADSTVEEMHMLTQRCRCSHRDAEASKICIFKLN